MKAYAMSEEAWYYVNNGLRIGPMSLKEIIITLPDAENVLVWCEASPRLLPRHEMALAPNRNLLANRRFQRAFSSSRAARIVGVCSQLLLRYADRAYKRFCYLSVRPEMAHRASCIDRLPSLAIGTASRSAFALRNVSPGAYPSAWG